MFTLPKLPYDYDALEPAVSSDTLQFHHDKHHRAYVEKTNELAPKAGLDGRSLEEVVREASRTGDKTLFHNAAQAWNHAFFWNCMAPRDDRGGERPSGDLARQIDQGVRRLRRVQGRLRRRGLQPLRLGLGLAGGGLGRPEGDLHP
jgi:Fe-Mn family superoxide dismutase